MSDFPIVVEASYSAPVTTVWRALTDKAQMKQWYFDLQDFRPEVGFEFSFDGKGTEGETYTHRCTIIEVVPEKKLAHSWRYEGYDGDSLVSFELLPEGSATCMKLTHAGVDSLPSDNPAFRRENFVLGWTEIIGNSLRKFVEEVSAV